MRIPASKTCTGTPGSRKDSSSILPSPPTKKGHFLLAPLGKSSFAKTEIPAKLYPCLVMARLSYGSVQFAFSRDPVFFISAFDPILALTVKIRENLGHDANTSR